jgi:hypothetical protein
VSRSSVHDDGGDLPLHDLDAPRGQAGPLLVGEVARGVPEHGHPVAELPEQLRLVHGQRAGGEHADALVAHLPAVAVRAVQDVAAPALRQALDGGQLVDEPGGDEQPPGVRAGAVGEDGGEAGAGALDGGDAPVRTSAP